MIIRKVNLFLLLKLLLVPYCMASSQVGFTAITSRSNALVYHWHIVIFCLAVLAIITAMLLAYFLFLEQEYKQQLVARDSLSYIRFCWPMFGVLVCLLPAIFLCWQLGRTPKADVTMHILAYGGHNRYDYDDADARVLSGYSLVHEQAAPLVVPVQEKILLMEDQAPTGPIWWRRSAGAGKPAVFHHALFGKIDKPGYYRVACAYRCGISHMAWPLQVEAKNTKDYLSWQRQHAKFI